MELTALISTSRQERHVDAAYLAYGLLDARIPDVLSLKLAIGHFTQRISRPFQEPINVCAVHEACSSSVDQT